MARATKKDKDLLARIRERFRVMEEGDRDNRRNGMDDMKFINIPGYQWDNNMKKERGKRPCYEFNKIRVTGKRIINDMRANRPAGKVRGVEGGDKDIAEIYDGLIRNIWNVSDGETVTDYASEYQVCSGMGAWRIVTKYSNDSAFDQDIFLEEIPNPYTLFADPSARDMLKEDAQDWLLTEKVARPAFEKKYGEQKAVSFEDHEFDDDDEWETEEEVRIAEYWYKEQYKKEIWLLEDGVVVDSTTDEAQGIPEEAIVKKREVNADRIMMCIASGNAILEGPTEWAGSMFPFVQVYGEYMIIDGKVHWCGIGRYAKDAQRSYNVSRTAITETIAQAPQAKWWVTSEQAEGHVKNWAEAHQKNFPFLQYNPDVKAPGPPTRMGGADVPVALIQESQLASEEINMVTGIYQHDVGAPNPAKSGTQEGLRISQGAIATFNYQDNMAKGIRRTWQILIDLIPRIYDTEREIRILGSDGAEDYVRINKFVPGEDGRPTKVNDLSVGKYDVTVTVGPSFTTRRQEAAETYQALLQSSPDMFPIIGDLIFKSMDLPYAEDIAERLKLMAPPEVQQLINRDANIPPEIQMMMREAEQAMGMVEERMALVQEAANEAEMEQAEVEKLIANLKTMMADLEAKEAKFEANVTKQVSQFSSIKTRLEDMPSSAEERQEIQAELNEFKEAVSNDLSDVAADVLTSIKLEAAEFVAEANATLDRFNTKPRIKEVRLVRENGEAKAVPEYE